MYMNQVKDGHKVLQRFMSNHKHSITAPPPSSIAWRSTHREQHHTRVLLLSRWTSVHQMLGLPFLTTAGWWPVQRGGRMERSPTQVAGLLLVSGPPCGGEGERASCPSRKRTMELVGNCRKALFLSTNDQPEYSREMLRVPLHYSVTALNSHGFIFMETRNLPFAEKRNSSLIERSSAFP